MLGINLFTSFRNVYNVWSEEARAKMNACFVTWIILLADVHNYDYACYRLLILDGKTKRSCSLLQVGNRSEAFFITYSTIWTWINLNRLWSIPSRTLNRLTGAQLQGHIPYFWGKVIEKGLGSVLLFSFGQEIHLFLRNKASSDALLHDAFQMRSFTSHGRWWDIWAPS